VRSALALVFLLLLSGCAVRPPATLRIDAPPGSPLARLVARSGFVAVSTYAPGDRREGRRRAAVAGGSGTLIGDHGLVATAAHIAVGPTYRLRVTRPGEGSFEGRVLALLPEKDLAILCVPGLVGHAGARLRLSDPLPGSPVLAFGSPGRTRIAAAAGRVRGGRLSGSIHYGRFVLEAPLELELSIEPGFSGGPVLDTDGEVVGILASFAVDLEAEGGPANLGLAFAVPGETLAAGMPAEAETACAAKSAPSSLL